MGNKTGDMWVLIDEARGLMRFMLDGVGGKVGMVNGRMC